MNKRIKIILPLVVLAMIIAIGFMLGHKDVSSMQVYSKLVEEYRAHPRA